MDEVKPRTYADKIEDYKRLQRQLDIKEGTTNVTHEIAKNMLLSGEKENKIQSYTKLFLNEILNLKKQLNTL